MVQHVDELAHLLDLEQIEIGLFRGNHPRTSLQRSFGGQVLAQALMAALRTVDEGRTVHSLHSYFLRAGRTDAPIIYDVELTRDGGSFSSRRVVARQHGKEIFHLAASFQGEESGLEHQDPAPPARPPEDCPSLVTAMSEDFRRTSGSAMPAPVVEQWREEWGVLDVRRVGDSARRPGKPQIETVPAENHAGHSRVWVRVDGTLPGLQHIHPCALAWASDLTLLAASVVPHAEVRWGSPSLIAASLDHAMWFHRPLRADQWWLYDQTTPAAQNNRGMSLGRIFQDGRLVATVAQEGLIRVVS